MSRLQLELTKGLGFASTVSTMLPPGKLPETLLEKPWEKALGEPPGNLHGRRMFSSEALDPFCNAESTRQVGKAEGGSLRFHKRTIADGNYVSTKEEGSSNVSSSCIRTIWSQSLTTNRYGSQAKMLTRMIPTATRSSFWAYVEII